jgi:6-phosphogluconolactonase
MKKVQIFDTTEALTNAAVKQILESGQEALKERGRFIIALSGGSTPKAVYQKLAEEHKNTLNWENVYFFHGDDRHVPYESDLSNAKMVDETLLNHLNVDRSKVFHLMPDVTLNQAAKEYDLAIRSVFADKEPIFDLVMLGMGSDGHTASLFPGTDIVHEKEKHIGVSRNEAQGTDRVSFTAPLINKARTVMFLIKGEDKAETFAEVMQGDFQPEKLPSQLIDTKNGDTLFFLDKSAASKYEGDK